MRTHHPRRRFGQNFLHDAAVIERMITAIAPRSDQTLLEIGPGEGALTAPLLERVATLYAVEIDRDLAAALAERFAPTLRLIEGDALTLDLASLQPPAGERLRVVGNLPYNVSTPILFHLLANCELIADLHLLLQREVVDRMVAPPGGKTRGRLSVMVQYRCAVTRCFNVPAGAFFPVPKVMSSFVRLTPHRPLPHPAADEPLFERIVAAAFAGRRKTLRNSLRSLLPEATEGPLWEATGIDPGRRAETVSVAEFVALSNAAAAATSPS
ncbi:16S rRNA (adenine(1518)-N(6)/adenine(1519)-N(6))-dimethyltransferase [Halorhodospira abdelmalekii]|uniref:16S rRNA (adenine(1518)-N(6)/adenine(1519)-N(6))- dimethyltransferase RsmA n=1 Tax=Halorhodospira abdelmalekii TaxID=421629 RepID=UPI0019046E32|nr:16S rRNA (adenine(1518)-N(6)/adenine(1519)-N(6))-dimethyltransferase RsmA [Halorhodospira abdelmalekii]MBK1734006.1 16S rRNA (adenine(1518)-N(6)/adenine(1519)-N(6))-dimethyltransferase [Halorhodospira abdelmalekii]